MEKNISQKIDKFLCSFKKLSFKKGETIMRPDEEPRGIFYLKKGYARLYSLSKNAQEFTFVIYKPEDFFPYIWSFNDTPVIYYTEAMTAVELYQIPREEFLKFIKSNNEVLYEITSRILVRFGGLLTRIEHAIFGTAYHKVAAIIAISAERLGHTNKYNTMIQVPLTHQDLANLLGVARETVSIEMKKLQNKGLISYKGRNLLVKDLAKLKTETLLG